MKIKHMELRNFRGAHDLKIQFSEHLNVFAGINGSGKSTLLDALAISLSWLVNRIQRAGNSGRPIPDPSIRNDESAAYIGVEVEEADKIYGWLLARSAVGKSTEHRSSLEGASSLAEYYRKDYEENLSLPVVAYYTVNRIVGPTVPELPDRDTVYTLDVYENALGGKANFQSFFEWFRVQEDILNERRGTKEEWFLTNKGWSQRQVKRLFNSFLNCFPMTDRDAGHYLSKRIDSRFNKNFPWENPSFFFHEIIDILHSLEHRTPNNMRLVRVLHDFEYLLFKFSEIHQFEDELDARKSLSKLLHLVFISLREVQHDEDTVDFSSFIWEMLSFVTQMSLWWMTEEGKNAISHIFRRQGNSYIRRFRLEPSFKLEEELSEAIQEVITLELARKRGASKNEGREVSFVRRAIEAFVPEYSNLRVKRSPRPHMLVDKKNTTLNLDQLSDGEKNLIALVGDIARRLCIANPTLSNPLEGEGVILIDEVDLHLHPQWQRMVINQLIKAFPNCQFIITTHSPQVLGEVEPEDVRMLYSDPHVGIQFWHPEQTYGLSSNSIIDEVMKPDDFNGTLARNQDVENELNSIFRLIDAEDYQKARKKFKKLKVRLHGSTPELVRAQSLLVMLDPEGGQV